MEFYDEDRVVIVAVPQSLQKSMALSSSGWGVCRLAVPRTTPGMLSGLSEGFCGALPERP